MTTEITWADLIADLHRMKGWEADWDGEGAVAPYGPALESAIMLAGIYEGKIAPASFVVVTPAGGIQFEWTGEGAAMEVEIFRTGNQPR